MADDKDKNEKTGQGSAQKSGEGVEQSKAEAKATARGATDAEAGAEVGLTEGEVHALRASSGVDQSPGHTANLLEWEATEGGKAFLKAEKERQEAHKDEIKRVSEATNKDGLDEDAEKYLKALNKK